MFIMHYIYTVHPYINSPMGWGYSVHQFFSTTFFKTTFKQVQNIDGLMKKSCNSSVLAMELYLFSTELSI